MSAAHYAFAFLSSTPMRAEPTDRSEMVNVVLFGEAFEILERQPKWIKIRLQHDGYEGWIDPQMCTLIPEEEYERIRTAPKYFNSATASEIKDENGRVFSLTKGACFPGLEGHEVKIGPRTFHFDGPLQNSSKIEVPLSRRHYRTQAHPTCGAAEPPSASIVVDLPRWCTG